jgi:hypothetical protein
MGHNAFVERYDRPNYKLHVIIFLAITGVSVFLSAQVEKTRDKADIAALKAPVPIDSVAMVEEAASQQIQPSIKPPIVAQSSQPDNTAEPAVNMENVQEYTFEDSPNLENINALLTTENTESVTDAAKSDISMSEEDTNVAAIASESMVELSEKTETEKSQSLTEQVAQTEQAESSISLDQVFQQQHDRFLQTLAKTAEVEAEESVEITQLKQAILSDKPLAAPKSQPTTTVSTSSSEPTNKEITKAVAEVKPVSDKVVISKKRVTTEQNPLQQVALSQSTSQQATSINQSIESGSLSQQVKTVDAIVMTKGELDNVVNQFTNSYNAGDISRLMALFAENAHTNDQQNKMGIEADYAELFSNTSSRKLMINDINWKFGKGKAEGAAEFIVTVQPKNGLEENSFRGQIKITAIKQSKGVYITRLLHELKQ